MKRTFKEKTDRSSMAKSKTKSRPVKTFHPNTISIPEDDTIGVYSDTVVYTEVIDAVTGERLGTPDMSIVKATMRPSTRAESTMEGKYYIANYK